MLSCGGGRYWTPRGVGCPIVGNCGYTSGNFSSGTFAIITPCHSDNGGFRNCYCVRGR